MGFHTTFLAAEKVSCHLNLQNQRTLESSNAHSLGIMVHGMIICHSFRWNWCCHDFLSNWWCSIWTNYFLCKLISSWTLHGSNSPQVDSATMALMSSSDSMDPCPPSFFVLGILFDAFQQYLQVWSISLCVNRSAWLQNWTTLMRMSHSALMSLHKSSRMDVSAWAQTKCSSSNTGRCCTIDVVSCSQAYPELFFCSA